VLNRLLNLSADVSVATEAEILIRCPNLRCLPQEHWNLAAVRIVTRLTGLSGRFMVRDGLLHSLLKPEMAKNAQPLIRPRQQTREFRRVGGVTALARLESDGSVKHRVDFTSQAREVFGAVKALVEAGGGTLDHVVKITTYVTDVRHRPEFRAIREEFFGTKGPASTMVGVSARAHPDYLIEVEVVAVI